MTRTRGVGDYRPRPADPFTGTPMSEAFYAADPRPDVRALAAKRAGMAQAATNSRVWRETATPILRAWLLRLEDDQAITTDNIRRHAHIPEPPTTKQSQAWWGPFVRSACTWGWLERTGHETTSTTRVGHGNRTDVYRINRAAVVRGVPSSRTKQARGRAA